MNMATRYEIRQGVKSVRKKWLVVVAENGYSERVLIAEYEQLVKDNPDTYFELVKIESSEVCMKFTPIYAMTPNVQIEARRAFAPSLSNAGLEPCLTTERSMNENTLKDFGARPKINIKGSNVKLGENMITALTGMTEELWLKRCAARFAEKAPWLSEEDCAEQASMCFEYCAENNLHKHPEDCADEEMSEWTDDGE